MNKAQPFRFLRNRLAKAWISPLVLGAFLFSVLVYCMCGPFCARTMAEQAGEPVAVASGCCSSHAPVQEKTSTTSGCCKHEPGETHCEDDLAEHAMQLSDSSISFTVPAAEIIDLMLPEPSGLTVRYERAVAATVIPITPLYIEFQSFLI